jgi:hypothetical protein
MNFNNLLSSTTTANGLAPTNSAHTHSASHLGGPNLTVIK